MRKVVLVLFACMILLGFLSVVHAEEISANDSSNITIDSDTAREAAIMDSHFGAQVRVLQLQRELQRRILWSNAVIGVLKNKSVDTADLEGIVVQLQILANETTTIPLEGTRNETVAEFVLIKKDALSLMQEFRNKAKGNLSAEDRQSLELTFKEIDRTSLHDITHSIEELRREYNAERVAKAYDSFGLDGSTIAAKIKSGELSVQDALKDLRMNFMNLTREKRNEVRDKFNNDRDAHERDLNRSIMYIREHFLNKTAERLDTRAEKLRKMNMPKLAMQLEKDAQHFADRANKIEARPRPLMPVRRTGDGGAHGETNESVSVSANVSADIGVSTK